MPLPLTNFVVQQIYGACNSMVKATSPQRNSTAQPKQPNSPVKTAFRRSPYREHTTVIRVPNSLLPRIQKMLAECRADVADAAWLNK